MHLWLLFRLFHSGLYCKYWGQIDILILIDGGNGAILLEGVLIFSLCFGVLGGISSVKDIQYVVHPPLIEVECFQYERIDGEKLVYTHNKIIYLVNITCKYSNIISFIQLTVNPLPYLKAFTTNFYIF